jgi:hypothetical protein
MAELTALCDQLKTGLSGAAHEPGTDDGPSLPVLAEHIKALKAANTIEAAPQRVRQKHLSAEEPITARIRRRTNTIPASGHAVDAASDDEAFPSSDPSQNSPDDPPAMYQKRITMERQRKIDGLPSPD